jgi:Ran GTPase-activating protein (RanGAP) involved in mRNA processing and transport
MNFSLSGFSTKNTWFVTIKNEDGWKDLSKVLSSDHMVTSISFSRINFEESIALFKFLASNSTLVFLLLIDSNIDCVALGSALASNSTPISLKLCNNRIDECSNELFKGLAFNSTLTSLDLTGTEIGDDGCIALSKALSVNSTLTSLDLNGIKIRDGGCIALSKALSVNSTLTKLNLNDSWIEDIGCIALSKALSVNSTLTKLNLNDNMITSEGAFALFNVLTVNSTLTFLSIFIIDDDITRIHKDLNKIIERNMNNKKLKELNLFSFLSKLML